MERPEDDLTEPDTIEDVRAHEDEGRQRAARVEAERAQAEREAELPHPDQEERESGLADEPDTARPGVFRAPDGTSGDR